MRGATGGRSFPAQYWGSTGAPWWLAGDVSFCCCPSCRSWRPVATMHWGGPAKGLPGVQARTRSGKLAACWGGGAGLEPGVTPTAGASSSLPFPCPAQSPPPGPGNCRNPPPPVFPDDVIGLSCDGLGLGWRGGGGRLPSSLGSPQEAPPRPLPRSTFHRAEHAMDVMPASSWGGGQRTLPITAPDPHALGRMQCCPEWTLGAPSTYGGGPISGFLLWERSRALLKPPAPPPPLPPCVGPDVCPVPSHLRLLESFSGGGRVFSSWEQLVQVGEGLCGRVPGTAAWQPASHVGGGPLQQGGPVGSLRWVAEAGPEVGLPALLVALEALGRGRLAGPWAPAGAVLWAGAPGCGGSPVRRLSAVWRLTRGRRACAVGRVHCRSGRGALTS